MIPALERSSGLKAGRDFGVAMNPEYLREGTGVADFDTPEKTVIGQLDAESGDAVAEMFGDFADRIFRVPIRVAEAAKYVDNAFHALKVGFANEVGALSVEFGIDSHQLMDIFKADRKLNISEAYLTPGFCFGGSCLPKDLSGMLSLAREAGLSAPLLAGAKESNAVHLAWIFQEVRRRCPPPGPVLLVGLSFKAGTDDLRNSPNRELAELLLEAGYDLHVHDPDLDPERLTGVNFALALEHQEALRARFAADLGSAAVKARLCVLGKPVPGVRDRLPPGLDVLDLTRLGA